MARSLLRFTGMIDGAALVGVLGTVCMVAGCHVSGCRSDDQTCAMITQGETSTSEATMDFTTGTPTAASEPGTSTGDGTLTGSDTTTDPDAVCGDGVVAGDEPCDDENEASDDACLPGCISARCGDGYIHLGVEQCDDGNDDDTDECTGKCELPRCGDGFVHPPELCDAGKANNDSIYGGCGSQCQPGPGCGDGLLNGPEQCDDQNEAPEDGCLPGCIDATSCLQILENTPGAPSGTYRLWPEALGGNIDVLVQCDMETDGGGYTFLKVDTEVGNAGDKGAKTAETVCAGYGMHLFVPRTQAHLQSAHALALAKNLTPVGGGSIGQGAEFLSILAIFPTMVGATCEGMGLNSVDCPGWRARDDGPFWVTDVAVPGEPSDEHCLGCSMFYKWNADATLKSYTTFPVGEGASSYRFFCDVGDKM